MFCFYSTMFILLFWMAGRLERISSYLEVWRQWMRTGTLWFRVVSMWTQVSRPLTWGWARQMISIRALVLLWLEEPPWSVCQDRLTPYKWEESQLSWVINSWRENIRKRVCAVQYYAYELVRSHKISWIGDAALSQTVPHCTSSWGPSGGTNVFLSICVCTYNTYILIW